MRMVEEGIQQQQPNGDTYGCVKSFCYLGDTLDGAGIAATARIRNGWMKFREVLPFLTSRAEGRVYTSCVKKWLMLGQSSKEQRCR